VKKVEPGHRGSGCKEDRQAESREARFRYAEPALLFGALPALPPIKSSASAAKQCTLSAAIFVRAGLRVGSGQDSRNNCMPGGHLDEPSARSEGQGPKTVSPRFLRRRSSRWMPRIRAMRTPNPVASPGHVAGAQVGPPGGNDAPAGKASTSGGVVEDRADPRPRRWGFPSGSIPRTEMAASGPGVFSRWRMGPGKPGTPMTAWCRLCATVRRPDRRRGLPAVAGSTSSPPPWRTAPRGALVCGAVSRDRVATGRGWPSRGQARAETWPRPRLDFSCARAAGPCPPSLIYPVTITHSTRRSYHQYATGYGPHAETMCYFLEKLPADPTDGRISTPRASGGNLRGPCHRPRPHWPSYDVLRDRARRMPLD